MTRTDQETDSQSDRKQDHTTMVRNSGPGRLEPRREQASTRGRGRKAGMQVGLPQAELVKSCILVEEQSGNR